MDLREIIKQLERLPSADPYKRWALDLIIGFQQELRKEEGKVSLTDYRKALRRVLGEEEHTHWASELDR